MYVHLLHALPTIVVMIAVLVAGITDLRRFQIYNVLTIPLILSGLVFHVFFGQTVGLSVSIWGILVATLPFFALYVRGGMGAGDLKLMAGVGAWMGPWFILHVIIVSGFATGLYSAVLIIRNRFRSAATLRETVRLDRINPEQKLSDDATDIRAVLSRSDRRENAVPFGAMVALGVIVSDFWIG